MRNDTRQNATTTTPRSLWITIAAVVSGASIVAQVSGVSGGVRESSGHPLTCENTRCPECPDGFGVRSTIDNPVDNSFPQVRAGKANLSYSRVAKCPKTVRTPSDLHKRTTSQGVREAKKHQFRCATGCPVLSPCRGGGSSGHPAPATPHARPRRHRTRDKSNPSNTQTKGAPQ